MDFDVIPYEDIQGDWKRLGSGSFGNVYKGTYLGIDVAIKEVLPSKDYDVAKYFEREWRLMKEARHPNVVLFLGLSRAPPPDNRIFIVSEFIDNGNLRIAIHDTRIPLLWPLRLSILTDIARALAYLHARRCIHRDLKGENLLLTANMRVKVTDFGFARIAARSVEESKRLTFCGTDSYMSPEILSGEEFDLPTDVFSMGIIFCEVIARKLADDTVFKRSAPHWAIDPDEVRSRASPGCPPALVDLALDCCATNPQARPTMREVLVRLRAIELAVLEQAGDAHVGSVKFFTAGSRKRPSAAPRIPSFGMGVGSEIRGGGGGVKADGAGDVKKDVSGDEAEELNEAVRKLENISVSKGPLHVHPPGHGRTPASEKSQWESPRWQDGSMVYTQRSEDYGYIPSEPGSDANTPLVEKPPTDSIPSTDSAPMPSRFTTYSETVIRLHGKLHTAAPSVATAIPESNASSIQAVSKSDDAAERDTASTITVRASPLIASPPMPDRPPPPLLDPSHSAMSLDEASEASKVVQVENGPGSRMSIDTFQTASSRVMPGAMPATHSLALGSIAGATVGSIAGSTEDSTRTADFSEPGHTHSLIHRFSLIKPSSGRKGSMSTSPSAVLANGRGGSPPPDQAPGWSPFEFFFSSGLGAKCDVCLKRLGWGWKPVLECDDCGMRTHIKCAESAPMDCGLREPRNSNPPLPSPRVSSPTSPKNKLNPRRKSGENALA